MQNCRRSLEMSGPRPLEMSGSKDGMDVDERTRSETDRSVERGAAGVARWLRQQPCWRSASGRRIGCWRGMKERRRQRLIHKARGRTSNRQPERRRPEVCGRVGQDQVRGLRADAGDRGAAGQARLRVGRETLRRWMMAEGLWLSRTQRSTFHQPRLRRESYGELIQIDGSDHRWFEQRGEPCTLLVFIDDATSKLMQLRFVPSESTDSYFEALNGYLTTHGCPAAFYSDKHTVFRVNRPDAKGGQGMTQFGRALAELNIEILCANSSQAKGRVERANRTLQDRLVKELRMAGICDMDAGNAFLPGFMEQFNEKFSVPQRSLRTCTAAQCAASRLRDILCHREQRYVGQQLSFALRPQADHPGTQ